MSDSTDVVSKSNAIDNDDENDGTVINGHNASKPTESTDDSSWQQLTNNGDNTNTDDIDIESFESPQKSEQSSILSNDSFINVEHDEKVDDEEEFEKNLDISLQHKTNGNRYYKLKQYDEALNEYTMSIQHCPLNDDKDNEYLSIFYGNRGACYIAMEEWELAIEECTESIANNDKYIKAYWRRAKAYEKLEKYYDAKQDYNAIIDIDPNHEISKANLQRIEPLVQKQFEQQKDEVIDKLKGFANWGLGKIGLSLDNFETKQDPVTGSYNINFKQNSGH